MLSEGEIIAIGVGAFIIFVVIPVICCCVLCGLCCACCGNCGRRKEKQNNVVIYSQTPPQYPQQQQTLQHPSVINVNQPQSTGYYDPRVNFNSNFPPTPHQPYYVSDNRYKPLTDFGLNRNNNNSYYGENYNGRNTPRNYLGQSNYDIYQKNPGK